MYMFTRRTPGPVDILPRYFSLTHIFNFCLVEGPIFLTNQMRLHLYLYTAAHVSARTGSHNQEETDGTWA